MKKIPYAIIIMDGYGLAPSGAGNAITIEIGRASCRERV